MKLIKYITSGILIVIVLIFIGEIFVWHIVNFETNFSYTTMYLQKETTNNEMKRDISNAARMNNIKVFIVEKTINSLFSEKLDVYVTKDAEEVLKRDSGILQGRFKSLLLGEVEVRYKAFEDISDISKLNTFYLIGNKDDIIKFKQSLVNKYAGKYPQFVPESLGDRPTIIGIWIIVLSLFLLLTNYEIAYIKKEVTVRIVLGERVENIIIKNVVLDIIVYCSLFSAAIYFLGKYTNTRYLQNITTACFILFNILNSLLYLKLLLADYKQDIATKTGGKNLLKASYLFKMISIVVCIITMSGCVDLIYKGIDFHKQYDFFERYKDYSYLTISSNDFDQTLQMNLKLYKKILEEDNSISLVNLGSWTYNKYIMADSGAVDYLKDQITDLKEINLRNKVYFILPQNDINDLNIKQEMKDIWESYYKGDYDCEILSYNHNIDIISIENIGKIESTMIKNPVIILNNMNSDSLENYWNIGYIANSTLYRITNNDWNKFINDINYEDELHYETNAFDNYLYQWQFVQKNLYIGIVLFLLVMLLETIIINTILKFEFSINSIELSLKKINGYSLYNRHRKIILITGILGLLSLIIATIISYVLKLSSVIDVATGGGLIIISEMFIIIMYVNKLERFNIQKILKGGQV